MIFTTHFNKQFNGIIYAKGYYKIENCRTVGKGSLSISLVLPLDGCGSTTISDSWDLTNGITSFQNKIIIMFDNDLGIMSAWDSAYKASCAMGGNNGPKISSQITVPMLDTSKVAPTTMNMPPAFMKIVSGKVPTAPRASLLRLGEIGTIVITIQDNVGIFDLTILNCVAHDGMNIGKIELLDGQGCPVHSKIIGPQTREIFGHDMLIYAHFKVFKFPDVENVYFECNIKFCFHRCQQPQCGIYGVYTGDGGVNRRKRSKRSQYNNGDISTLTYKNNNTYNLFQTIIVEIPEVDENINKTKKIYSVVKSQKQISEENAFESYPIVRNLCMTKMTIVTSLIFVTILLSSLISAITYICYKRVKETQKNLPDDICYLPYRNDLKHCDSSFPSSPVSQKNIELKKI
ncbi:unnamed protein product [Gordionus sp. m RMFG-2023]